MHFSDIEAQLMQSSALDGVEAAPGEYLRLTTGNSRSEVWDAIIGYFDALPGRELSTAQLTEIIHCMKLSVMFVADFEYHARTGFNKDDVLAFIVAMETTGKPPERYPMNLK